MLVINSSKMIYTASLRKTQLGEDIKLEEVDVKIEASGYASKHRRKRVENEIIIAIIAEKKTLTCHSTTKVCSRVYR